MSSLQTHKGSVVHCAKGTWIEGGEMAYLLLLANHNLAVSSIKM